MDSAALARAIASELLQSNSVWLLLLTVALFSGAGAYLGKYLGTKGKNLATKEDFDQLQTQLADSTHLVERIKKEIEHTDWAAREWDSLRLKKIEELMTALYECEAFLDEIMNTSMEGQVLKKTPPFGHPTVVSELYLPELSKLVAEYVYACRELYIATLERGQKTIAAKAQGQDVTAPWGDYPLETLYPKLISTHEAIRKTASQLLQTIMQDRTPK